MNAYDQGPGGGGSEPRRSWLTAAKLSMPFKRSKRLGGIMWLLVFVPACFGIFKYRFWNYWKWVVFLFLWQQAGSLLFQGNGTKEDPSGDGLITRIIREQFDDAGVGLFSIGFLIVFYGVTFLFLGKMYRAAKQRGAQSFESQNASPLRKWLELLGLAAVVGGLLYWSFEQNLAASKATERSQPTDSEIEAQLRTASQSVNQSLPKDVGGGVVLTATHVQGRVFTYEYSLPGALGSPADHVSRSAGSIKSKVCSDRQMRADIDDFAIIYVYRYTSEPNSIPAEVAVTSKVCSEPGVVQ